MNECFIFFFGKNIKGQGSLVWSSILLKNFNRESLNSTNYLLISKELKKKTKEFKFKGKYLNFFKAYFILLYLLIKKKILS